MYIHLNISSLKQVLSWTRERLNTVTLEELYDVVILNLKLLLSTLMEI
jgi:hypothetical protein